MEVRVGRRREEAMRGENSEVGGEVGKEGEIRSSDDPIMGVVEVGELNGIRRLEAKGLERE